MSENYVNKLKSLGLVPGGFREYADKRDKYGNQIRDYRDGRMDAKINAPFVRIKARQEEVRERMQGGVPIYLDFEKAWHQIRRGK